MRTIVLAVVVCCFAQAGCGLIAQGRHQDLRVYAEPRDAGITLDGTPAKNGDTVRIGRREPWRVLRAEREGYQPACKMVGCPRVAFIVVLDSIPLAIPLLVDLSFGTLRRCPDSATVTLPPLSPRRVAYELPDDRSAVIAKERGVDACEFAPLSRIIVSAAPLPQAHEILGQIRVVDSDFGKFGLERSPENLDFLLRRKAYDRFGDKVDAIIGVGSQYAGSSLTYSYWKGFGTEEGSAFATGVAIRFLEER